MRGICFEASSSSSAAEFLDITAQAMISPLDGAGEGNAYRITNIGTSVIDTNLIVVVSGLPEDARLLNASGTTSGGDPYLRLFPRDGVLNPGEHVVVRLLFAGVKGEHADRYSFVLLSGQGKP